MSQETSSSLQSADILRLLELLPHRYPFLMIDRLNDLEPGISGIGIKNVTFNEIHFLGHFPNHPIMPGVLLIEGMAQTAGAIVVAGQDTQEAPAMVFFMTIDKAKFRRPVVPGDTVAYHAKKIKHRQSVWKFSVEALVEGRKVAEAEIGAMLAGGDGQ